MKPPEEILALKVCDPACGSGTFPLNALRFLTEALYNSLHHHNRIEYFSDRTVIDLIIDEESKQTLADEKLPCRPEDNDFEARTKAVLRRYIVERCIYGVDLDPLAVELCRLSLWIETLDPRLPFTFLDHKIKCGNALIGTWFDQFMHYPAMAWMREGGDKAHSGGVHFEKETWTKLISGQKGDVQKQLIDYIDQQLYLNTGEDLDTVKTVHDDAEKALARIHNMGVHEAEQRARAYHALRESQEFQDAKFSLDLWNAIWFWPPEHIEHCPLPTDFYQGQLSAAAQQIVRDLANNWRFFHWQLEFPDVFSTSDDGFDAVLGNPPWDIAKPNSKEFFSALDPLYRSYGKQEALNKQKEYFDQDIETERRWLMYNAQFRAQSNWVKNSGGPYGNTVNTDSKGKQSQELNLGGGGGGSFDRSVRRHEKWKDNREGMSGYSQSLEDERGFHHQGGGDINLYKMFLEQAHAILRLAGRLGFIVPSGLYSDHGTGALRTLFLERCRWQWLFGFENREGIFDIHRSFKFNPVIIEKGGTTDVIQTAFMRRDLADWEHAEKFVTRYPRERVLQFSPRSKAILEIQSQRDLEVLEKIYSNSVLLGDDGPNGWGITYSREFDMTNDSKLFPPRDQWEARGYRPDEYSRWLKGNWRPIEELVSSGSCSVTGPSDHQSPTTNDDSSDHRFRRVDIPAGIILSRDGQSWISEDEIDTDEFDGYVRKSNKKKSVKIHGDCICLPLYEGRTIGQFDYSEKGWVSGKGRSAVWREIAWEKKQIEPQFLMAHPVFENSLIHSYITKLKDDRGEAIAKSEAKRLKEKSARDSWGLQNAFRLSFMDVSSATNTRTMIASVLGAYPCGNKTPMLLTQDRQLTLAGLLNSVSFDYQFRTRLVGTTLNYFIVEEAALPRSDLLSSSLQLLANIALRLNCAAAELAHWWLKTSLSQETAWRKYWATTEHERIRLRSISDAVVAAIYGFSAVDYRLAIRDCDHPSNKVALDNFTASLFPKGLWRVDKRREPEHRLTILSFVAFNDLTAYITAHGSIDEGISKFLSQNDGEGWQLPETLRLADYGLGHDDRAREHQPVRECFGPRFYDWQLEQDPEESWRECHLHARNLLGPTAYQALLDELASAQGSVTSRQSPTVREEASEFQTSNQQSHATDHQPPAADHQPPPAGHQPPTTDHHSPPDPDDFSLSSEPSEPKKRSRK